MKFVGLIRRNNLTKRNFAKYSGRQREDFKLIVVGTMVGSSIGTVTGVSIVYSLIHKKD